MSEQDLILEQKIQKREKFDIILAYILIVILLACIGIILYLKFLRKEEPTPEEYLPKYISLNEISTSLNSSILANRYTNDSAKLNSTVSGNSLVVTYTKEDDMVNLNIPVVDNELVVTIPSENKEIATDIYKEITNIICIYYGNKESSCRNTINNITSSNSIDGIRIENNKVYIDTTKSIEITTMPVKISIDSTDYEVTSENIKISNINVSNSDENISINGTIERLTSDIFSFSVVVKIYDINGNILDESSLEYTEDDMLSDKSSLIIGFMSDEYTYEDIKEYSVEIKK